MTEYVVLCKGFEARWFADVALWFIKNVFKEGWLSTIDCVLVFDEEGAKEAEDWARSNFPAGSNRMFVSSLVASRACDGSYVGWDVREPPTIIARIDYLDYRGFEVLVHEFMHHLFTPNDEALLRALRMDVPELDVLVSRLEEVVRKWIFRPFAEQELRDFGQDVVKFVREYSSEYAAFNYFVLLNTRPALDPIMLGGRVVGSYYADEVVERLSIGLERCWKALESEARYGIWEEAKKELERMEPVFSRIRLKLFERPELHHFRERVHSLLAGFVERWPKDVYLSSTERFEILFKGLDREWLKEHGVPMMV
jgi:hypothetical protein